MGDAMRGLRDDCRRLTDRIDELEEENSRLYRIIDGITRDVDEQRRCMGCFQSYFRSLRC